jgi:hypothetical protein
MKKVVCFWGVLFGGNANNSANAGLVYANTNNTPSNTNTNIGSQLCLKIKKKQKPWLLPKNKNVNRVLVGFFRMFPLNQQR